MKAGKVEIAVVRTTPSPVDMKMVCFLVTIKNEGMSDGAITTVIDCP